MKLDRKIGNVKLENPLVLAPMAGVNCQAFRRICRENGAGLVCTPMIVAKQLISNPETILKIAEIHKDEAPVSFQLVGSDKEEMAQATRIIEDRSDIPAKIIDINLGCPEKDILALKAGSFLIKHPEQIQKAVSPVISNTNKPVTAKIRIGWDDKTINTLQVVKILEDLGVSAIAIHGRTKAQGYSGKADWNEIKKAKEKANVPIIGNGDVFKPGNAKSIIERTGCDMVMIGRGSMGNPMLFRQCLELFKTGKGSEELSKEEKVRSFMRFAELYGQQQRQPLSELRQHAMWFVKGISGAAQIRNTILSLKDADSIIDIFKSLA